MISESAGPTMGPLYGPTYLKLKFLQSYRFLQRYRWGARLFPGFRKLGTNRRFSGFNEVLLGLQEQSRVPELPAGPHSVRGHGDGVASRGALPLTKKAPYYRR